ncbi:GIY-YIG nuclease family protein [Fructilactobacillus hinvesii]|uniref:GIY-YIG nuclease family protein n=1 Tax=Fructilactobacillus hinvesii TaxID=2940300 RepID=A0ABY5BT86_9LACO|nr:GIY-YIG nuclease family protein [Fructilactobacillus hinvesii]USS88343.1 GIY-YIG nuclease family protein [Fructilactobacillus hinvesii]
MQPFTIQTFFPTGDPSGFRVTEITRDSLQAYYIPKANLKTAIEQRPALAWNGVYTLFDASNATKAYIGEAENIGNRLKQHANPQENWWNIAVAFVINNRTHQLSKADIKFLENLMYSKAKSAKQMQLVNVNTPHQSFVTESRKYDLKSNFASIDILLRSLGFPLFVKREDSKSPISSNLNNDEIQVYLTNRNATASGIYSQHKKTLTVLAGSRVTDLEPTNSFAMEKQLNKLIQTGIIKDHFFTRDYQFNSASMAANILSKGNYSGPQVWHDQNQHPLNKLEQLSPSLLTKNRDLFHLVARGANAQASYDFKTKKTTVIKGSKLASKTAKSFSQTKLLTSLVHQQVITNNTFTKNYTFTSSSTAATIICKAPMSGPATWINNEGIRLKDLNNH